ncbi:MAG TPA: hypothetical protein VNI02_24720, partial [Blastocatellia bacterium]|nr:hypothetical protein [Blastocatellia bacterium]
LGRPEDVYMPEAENASAADVASEGAFNFNSGALQGEAIRASSWADSDVFKTQMLEPPAHLSHAEGRINTNPLEMPPASDFNRSSLSPAGFAELHEERSSSTLLAVDDPLGDVLVDEREMDVPSYDSRHAPQVLFGEQVANEEFDLEFNPQEQQVFDIPGPTATAAGMTGGLAETDNHISEESPLAIETIEQAADAYAAREGAVAEARQQSPDEAVEAASGFEPFGAAPIDAAPSDLNADWSGFGAEFGSEFQTSTSERHPNQAGYTFDEPEEGLDQNHGTAPGAAFTTSSMWDEQDARFAPIDIEATPVDEFERGRGMADHGAVETGFEIAPAMEEGPTHLAGAPVAQASQDAQPAKAEADAHTADLSPALVDEIVRRVVSQMSESVVREIAWEVVPDVVERVIKEMARNEVSKRN